MNKKFLALFLLPFMLASCGGTASNPVLPEMDVEFNDTNVSFDGMEHTIVASGYPEGSEITYFNEGPYVDIGTYLIGVEITNPNYQTFVDNATLTITEGIINATFEDVTISYDGLPHTIEATDYPQGATVSYSNKGPFINVGVYEIEATITCPNYRTFNKTATLTIEKQEMKNVVFADSIVTFDGFKHTIEPTGYPIGSQITYKSERYFINPGTYAISVEITHPDYKTYTGIATLKIKDVDGEVFEISAKDLLKNHPKATNLDGESQRIETCGINLSFNKNDGQAAPVYNGDNGGSLRLYSKNSLTIEAPLFNDLVAIQIAKIEFTCLKSEKVPNDAAISNGYLSYPTDTSFVWSGLADSIVLTIGTTAAWITNFKITYVNNEHMIDSLLGISSIATIKEAAKDIRYIPSNDGWYLTPTEVTVQIEAVDAIDSVATGGTLPGDARGKVLCVDKTGAILISSATSLSGGVTFYSRVKDYLKKGTTQYEVHGKLAFLNGVLEINVMSFEYKEDLIIEKNYESYVEKSFVLQEEFVNDTINSCVTNPKGYGAGHIVKMSSLTCYNCYNSGAGSYLFLDKEGNLIPVYSFLNKDRSLISIGSTYDVICFSTTYNYRPSLRILKLTKTSDLPVRFDYDENVVDSNDLTKFYNIKPGNDETYVRSELTMYKADVYVSYYANDKYTFNTKYFVGSDEHKYTTGTSQQDAANKKSLGVFNQDLDYKQTFLDFVIDDCNSAQEVNEKKVTLYFTLAFVDTVGGESMWRVNVIEELVKSKDYATGERMDIRFNTSEPGVTCVYEEKVYQIWSFNEFEVKNEANKIDDIQYSIKRDPTQLIIAQCTKLTLCFDKEILGFTFYHSTYSSFTYFDGLEFRCCDQRKDHTEIVLKNPSKTVEINYVELAGENYIKISKMELVYKK